jgi:type IV pilus assembly protein PilC
MQFSYRALKEGKIISQTITADSEQEVIKYLREKHYFPIEIKELRSKGNNPLGFLFDKISFNDITDFTRQIAIMLNAGLTLIDSFNILIKQTTKPAVKKLLTSIDENLRSGISFSASLQKYSQYFPNLYIALVKSGEASGKLADILLKLSDNLENEREFKGKLKGALIYPVVIVVAMCGVMFVMITFVLPQLMNLYKDFNVELPMSTKILMAVSSFSVKFWPLIIGAVIFIIILIKRYLKTKTGRIQKDTLLLKIPVIGNVIKISSLVNATRTLAILVGAGVSIMEALKIIVDTTDNIVFQNSFANIYKQVEKGQSLGNALDHERIFPPILVQMTIVGEQTGHLDATLMRLSKYFEMESTMAIKTMTTLIEPAILVVLGVGVGFLVMSVITPIYNLTSSFK